MSHQNKLGQVVGHPVTDWQVPPLPEGRPLQGTYCRLEPLRPHHAADLFRVNSEDAVGRMWTYMSYGPFATLETYSDWVITAENSADPLYYAVTRNEQAVGVASYLRIVPANGAVEIGHIAFSPSLQKTTAATEALFLLMDNAFELGYRRLEWKCDALNAPSRRAAGRLGFRFEGIFRQATVYKGRNRDTAWYAVLDREWPVLKKAFESWLREGNFGAAGEQRRSLSNLTARARATLDVDP